MTETNNSKKPEFTTVLSQCTAEVTKIMNDSYKYKHALVSICNKLLASDYPKTAVYDSICWTLMGMDMEDVLNQLDYMPIELNTAGLGMRYLQLIRKEELKTYGIETLLAAHKFTKLKDSDYCQCADDHEKYKYKVVITDNTVYVNYVGSIDDKKDVTE